MGGNWGVIESNWETVCTRLGASAASVRKAALARLKRPPLGHLIDGLEGALGRGRLAHCSGAGGGRGDWAKQGMCERKAYAVRWMGKMARVWHMEKNKA